jgi:hypothetical protein
MIERAVDLAFKALAAAAFVVSVEYFARRRKPSLESK